MDITTKNDNGGILLRSVTAGDLRKLVAIVILTGMNINERNRYATRSLPIAASQEHEEIVELLISEGTDLKIQNPKIWEIP